MKTQKIITLLAVVLFSAAIIFTSCKKEGSAGNTIAPAGQQNVSILLNDDPANYSKVLVDIQRVEVKIDTSKIHHDDHFFDGDDDGDDDQKDHDAFGQWASLNIRPGVYDLLKLRNGVDTMLANGNSFSGRISKIRITLGSGSTLWTDATHSFPLSICESKPFVYVKVASNTIDTLSGGAIKIRIDFDIAKSIKNKNGTYCLKPEIKAYSEHNTGALEGKVFPKEAKAMVTVFNSTDTANAFPEDGGEYKITGLKDGTYSIHFIATAPYKDSTITNIIVRKADNTKVAPVTLRK